MATQNIQIDKKEIAPGVFTTGGTAQAATNPSITNPTGTYGTVGGAVGSSNIGVADITPTTKLDVGSTFPTTNPPTIPDQPPVIPDAPVQTEADVLSTAIKDLSGSTSGKAVDTLNVANDPNVLAKKDEANRLADLYKTRNAEYDQLITGIEAGAGKKGLTTSAVTGQQGAILRQKASDLERINADYQVATGQFERAKESAQRLVDLKYAPLEEQLQIKKDQLLAIQPMLTQAQLKQSKAQEYAIKKEEQALADKKQTAKDNAKLANDYAKIAFDGGESQLGSQIAALDPSSPTFRQDLQKLQSKITNPIAKLDIALKNAQLEKIRKETSLLGEPSDKEKKEAADALKNAIASIPVMNDKIAAVDALKVSPGLNQRVGSNIQTRIPSGFWSGVGKAATVVGIPGLVADALQESTGSGQAFAGGVHKLVSGLTLDSLIAAKARGATFGALSEGELNILSNSASAINDWEIKDSKGKGTGVWDIDEESFKKELKTIQDLTRRAIYLSSGQVLAKDEQSLIDNTFSPDNTALDPANYYSN